MSAASEIVAECTRLGVRIEARADGLHLKPASAVPPELRARIREAKPELMALMSAPAPVESELRDTDTSAASAAWQDPRNFAWLSPQPEFDEEGRPLYGCWSCRSSLFARDLADTGWCCTTCHPVEEYRAHVARWTAPKASRRGGAS